MIGSVLLRLFAILLLVATIVGLAASRGTLLQERMSANSFDRSLALRPNDPDILCNRGNSLAELKRFNDAIESYDRALLIR